MEYSKEDLMEAKKQVTGVVTGEERPCSLPLAGFPYIVPGCDYMLTSRAHISQIIPRTVHHSSKHDAVIWNMSAVVTTLARLLKPHN